MTTAIGVEGLSKAFGATKAPDGLDLVVIARKEAATLRGNEMWLELDRMMAKALGERA